MSDDQGQGFMDTFGYGLIHMNFLAHIGFGFLGLSYLTKRMVHLRLCLCLANAWLVAWGVVALSGEAAWAAAGWNLLFFFINGRRFYQAVHTEKNKRAMSEGGKASAPSTVPVPPAAIGQAPGQVQATTAGLQSIRVQMSPASTRRSMSPANLMRARAHAPSSSLRPSPAGYRRSLSPKSSSWHNGSVFRTAPAPEAATPFLTSPLPSPPDSFVDRFSEGAGSIIPEADDLHAPRNSAPAPARKGLMALGTQKQDSKSDFVQMTQWWS